MVDATQGERRAETRERLLTAAAELFAERGVDGASIDAIAERAERTSGAVYDHFGGKDGVLLALLDRWVEDVGRRGQRRADHRGHDRRTAGGPLASVSEPSVGDGRWMTLEFELWAHALRNPELREHLTRRYRSAWRGIVGAASGTDGGIDGQNGATALVTVDDSDLGPAVIGLLFGLEMMRRIDPETDHRRPCRARAARRRRLVHDGPGPRKKR